MLCLSSVTVYAAIKLLTPAEVVEEMQDEKLSEVFLGDKAMVINETQSCGEYNATLLSIDSGELLSDYSYYNGTATIKTVGNRSKCIRRSNARRFGIL